MITRSYKIQCICEQLPFFTEFQNFHRRIRSWNDLRRNQSVFHQRTEDSSALQYFQVEIWITWNSFISHFNICSLSFEKVTYFLFSLQFYGCLSQQQNMLQDYHRTATYHKAILRNDVDFKDKVCVCFVLSVQLWQHYLFNLALNLENWLCSPPQNNFYTLFVYYIKDYSGWRLWPCVSQLYSVLLTLKWEQKRTNPRKDYNIYNCFKQTTTHT